MAMKDLKGRLARDPATSGRPFDGFLLSAWASLPDPTGHEAMLRAGFEAITFDMQHGLATLAEVREGIMRAKLLERPAFVRVPIGELSTAARCLDLGAQGIILPMIETANEARALVAAVKYPPLGRRSYGPARAAQIHNAGTGARYFAAANDAILALAMIETDGAFAALGEILGVEGLDGVFVGPADLSIALGEPVPNTGAVRTVEAVRGIARATAEAGRIAAIYAASVEEAQRYRDAGYDIVCVGSDVAFLTQAAAEAYSRLRG